MTANINFVATLISVFLTPILVAADWSVRIDGVYGQSIDFSTGDAPGASMKVELYDACRVDSAYRQELGELFPSNQVDGLSMDDSAIYNNPGCCNKISYAFEPDINTTSLFQDNFDGTGTVAFCAQVGLYDGGTIVNLAEVRVEYKMNTETQEVWLETYSITDAAGYTDAEDSGLGFDGDLQTYFCDPNSRTLMDYGVIGQGTIMSICLQAPDGQFEVKDVIELTVHGADGYGPSQAILSGSSVVEDSIALKSCYDNGDFDTNICIVQFLLKTEFFETSAVTLTGTGTVLLELGDSNERKLLRARIATPSALRRTPKSQRSAVDGDARRQMEVEEDGNLMTSAYQVKASRFFIDPGSRQTTTRGHTPLLRLSPNLDPVTNNILLSFFAMAGLLFFCVSVCFIAHKCSLRDSEEEEEDFELEKGDEVSPLPNDFKPKEALDQSAKSANSADKVSYLPDEFKVKEPLDRSAQSANSMSAMSSLSFSIRSALGASRERAS